MGGFLSVIIYGQICALARREVPALNWLLHNGRTLFLYTLIWLILNENVTPFQIMTGLLISAFAVFFTGYFLMPAPAREARPVTFFMIIRYSVCLISQIYQSGIAALPRIIRGRSRVQLVEYDTGLDNELAICLVANAITLTPGTVTVDKEGCVLKVLSFGDTPGDSGEIPVIQDLVCPRFLEILKGEKR